MADKTSIKGKVSLIRKFNSGFDVDLRKKLSPQKLGAITKAYNKIKKSIASNAGAQYILPKRLPKESKAAYNRRLSAAKSATGNATGVDGLFVKPPPGAKTKVNRAGEIEFIKPGKIKEKIIRITNPAAFFADPQAYLLGILGDPPKWDIVGPQHSAYGGSAVDVKNRDGSMNYGALARIANTITGLMNQYSKIQDKVLSGIRLGRFI